jgi:hypothetical protein
MTKLSSSPHAVRTFKQPRGDITCRQYRADVVEQAVHPGRTGEHPIGHVQILAGAELCSRISGIRRNGRYSAVGMIFSMVLYFFRRKRAFERSLGKPHYCPSILGG